MNFSASRLSCILALSACGWRGWDVENSSVDCFGIVLDFNFRNSFATTRQSVSAGWSVTQITSRFQAIMTSAQARFTSLTRGESKLVYILLPDASRARRNTPHSLFSWCSIHSLSTSPLHVRLDIATFDLGRHAERHAMLRFQCDQYTLHCMNRLIQSVQHLCSTQTLMTMLLLRIPSKMHVLSTGTYCSVMALIISCETMPPVRAPMLCSSAPPARTLWQH